MAIDFMWRGFRYTTELFLDTLGLIHLPKRNRLPPITNPLLLQSATSLTSKIKSGQVKQKKTDQFTTEYNC